MYKFVINDPLFLPHCACELDFTLEEGKLITLVGKNGVGKTSLARRIEDQLQGKMSYCPQEKSDFFYDRTLEQVKTIFLKSSPDIDQGFFQELWWAFHLEEKENRFLSSLSGGEAQALKLVLALSLRKPFYLLDEPSQFLDKESKLVLSQTLEKLLRDQKSLVMIEHDLSWTTLPMRIHQLEVWDHVLKVERSWNT
jgi:ABC-2 type transport system ATP-binding protein